MRHDSEHDGTTEGARVTPEEGRPGAADRMHLTDSPEPRRTSAELLSEAERLCRLGSWNWDRTRGVVDASPEFYRLLGIAPGHLPGAVDFERHVHPDDRPAVTAELDRLVGSRTSFGTVECRVVHPDGTTHWVTVRAELNYDPAGRLVAMWGTVQEVTERRELEEHLKQAQRMEILGQLAGGVAHDFTNILTAITMEADLLRGSLPNDDPLHADVLAIRKAAERGMDLTKQLLAFSRKQVLPPRPLDLNALVRDTSRMLQRLIGTEVELVAALAPSLPPVLGDPGQLQQVLVNLAINARDAMPGGGVLRIATARGRGEAHGLPTGQCVVLAVEDTGHGMDDETQRRIFEPFFTTKPEGSGTGLGLSVVLRIVEQAGGRISVRSAPGRGAHFTISLPCPGLESPAA